jgi:hypothetical protein
VNKETRKYETVEVGKLRRRRRGKHHELMQGILKDLDVLPTGKAMRIPLSSTKGVSLVNLRAAITRETSSEKLGVSTYFDGENLFVWKQKPKT